MQQKRLRGQNLDDIDRFANRYGGRLEISDTNLPWTKLLTQVERRCSASLHVPRHIVLWQKRKDIQFCFTMEESFNARCRFDPPSLFIAISAPLPPKLLEISRSIFSSGASFYRHQPHPFPYNNLNARAAISDSQIFDDLSDFNANYLARNAVFIATDIILNHELAHLVRGHAGWLSQRFGIKEVEEVSPLEGDDDLTRQTLEWDADACAVHRTLVRSLNLKLNPPGRNNGVHAPIPPYGPFGSWDQCLYTFSVSIYLLARFFELSRKKKGYANRYPPTWYRIQHLFHAVTHTIRCRTGLTEDAIENRIVPIIISGATEAEKAWCKSSKSERLLPFIFDKEPLSLGIDYTKLYLDRWSSITAELQEHWLMPSLWDAI